MCLYVDVTYLSINGPFTCYFAWNLLGHDI